MDFLSCQRSSIERLTRGNQTSRTITMKANINAHPSNVMEAHQVLMKGGDPDSQPPFKVVQSLRPTGGFDAGLLLSWL